MTPKELENYCQNIIEMGGGIAEKPTDTWYRVDVTEMRENDEGTLVPVDNND